MALKFRNIDVTPDAPVAQWGVEGIVTALERGGLVHVQRIAAEVVADPHGPVAADLEEALTLVDGPIPDRLAALLERLRDPRAEVRQRVRAAIARSGVSARTLARAVGTSPSRLSSYATGAVQPSAAALLTIERAAARLARSRDPLE